LLAIRVSLGAAIPLSLMASACVGTNETTQRLSDPATLEKGEGLAFGSIELRFPEVVAPEHVGMLEAFRERELTATLWRYEAHDLGIAGWRDYEGDRFVVQCRPEGEQTFVLRGPAGTYAIQELRDHHRYSDYCRVENLGSFDVQAGKVTYVGRLVIDVGFQSESFLFGLSTRRASEHEHAEQWLDLSLSTENAMEKALLELDLERAIDASAIETDLMGVGYVRGMWSYVPLPPPPKLPGMTPQ
jgi:hypothetical protein